MIVNLYVDHMASSPPASAEDVWSATRQHAKLYSDAAAKIGLTPSQYAQFRNALLEGRATYVTLPRRLDAMAGDRRGSVYVVRNAHLTAPVRGWRVALADGNVVYVPQACGNLSLLHRPRRRARAGSLQSDRVRTSRPGRAGRRCGGGRAAGNAGDGRAAATRSSGGGCGGPGGGSERPRAESVSVPDSCGASRYRRRRLARVAAFGTAVFRRFEFFGCVRDEVATPHRPFPEAVSARRLRNVAMRATPLPVVHVLDALTHAGSGLWGKERLVEGLMSAQRESGEVAPRLVVFTPCSLADAMRDRGFPVDVLEPEHARVPLRALPALRRILRGGPPAVVHAHGYKANVVTRAARLCGAPMLGLVTTAHAWFDESRATQLYNALDRRTAFMSDVMTLADRSMLRRFGKGCRLAYVANGLPDREPPSDTARRAARARFAFDSDRFTIGFLARTNAAKGIPELLEAARRTLDAPIVWAVAGTGELADAIVAAALPNVRYVGYVADSDAYRAGLDAFVQSSHIEGLSLSLLEAMRAGLPIVATDAGSTTHAVRDGREALVVARGDADALARAARTLASDRALAQRLGSAARARFVECFRVERQHREFLALYRSTVRA